jgi:hypothetical protein
VRLLALAVIAHAIVAAAGGVSIYTWGYRSSAPASYGGYEPVVREWFSMSRIEVTKIRHLAGPFYVLRYRSQKTLGSSTASWSTSAPSTRGGEGELDRLWWTDGPAGIAGKRGICDF